MTDRAAHKRPPAGVILLASAALICAAFVFSLGVWQVQRLQWKLDLIERVEARVNAEPIAAPGPEVWNTITPASSEYLNVQVRGRFEHDKAVLVQALTELGSGHWLLTPLSGDAGFSVLVNRGFVSPENRQRALRAENAPQDDVSITGLLRIAEPGGGFLRKNDPENDLWYSRDVDAIAQAKGIADIAPYFIDADASLNQADPELTGTPIGGMTVIRFANSHLVYAVTWFSLGLMLLAAGWYVIYDWRKKRSRSVSGGVS